MQNLEKAGIIWSHVLQTFYFFKKKSNLKKPPRKNKRSGGNCKIFYNKKTTGVAP